MVKGDGTERDMVGGSEMSRKKDIQNESKIRTSAACHSHRWRAGLDFRALGKWRRVAGSLFGGGVAVGRCKVAADEGRRRPMTPGPWLVSARPGHKRKKVWLDALHHDVPRNQHYAYVLVLRDCQGDASCFLHVCLLLTLLSCPSQRRKACKESNAASTASACDAHRHSSDVRSINGGKFNFVPFGSCGSWRPRGIDHGKRQKGRTELDNLRIGCDLPGRWDVSLKMHMYPVSHCVYVSGAEKGLMRFGVSSRLR